MVALFRPFLLLLILLPLLSPVHVCSADPGDSLSGQPDSTVDTKITVAPADDQHTQQENTKRDETRVEQSDVAGASTTAGSNTNGASSIDLVGLTASAELSTATVTPLDSAGQHATDTNNAVLTPPIDLTAGVSSSTENIPPGISAPAHSVSGTSDGAAAAVTGNSGIDQSESSHIESESNGPIGNNGNHTADTPNESDGSRSASESTTDTESPKDTHADDETDSAQPTSAAEGGEPIQPTNDEQARQQVDADDDDSGSSVVYELPSKSTSGGRNHSASVLRQADDAAQMSDSIGSERSPSEEVKEKSNTTPSDHVTHADDIDSNENQPRPRAPESTHTDKPPKQTQPDRTDSMPNINERDIDSHHDAAMPPTKRIDNNTHTDSENDAERPIHALPNDSDQRIEFDNEVDGERQSAEPGADSNGEVDSAGSHGRADSDSGDDSSSAPRARVVHSHGPAVRPEGSSPASSGASLIRDIIILIIVAVIAERSWALYKKHARGAIDRDGFATIQSVDDQFDHEEFDDERSHITPHAAESTRV